MFDFKFKFVIKYLKSASESGFASVLLAQSMVISGACIGFLLGLVFVVVDPLLGYRLCLICLLQRVLLGLIASILMLSGWLSGFKLRLGLWLGSGLSVMGIGLSVLHGAMILGLVSAQCSLVLPTKKAKTITGYHWVSCGQENTVILEVPLYVWAMLCFVVLLIWQQGLLRLNSRLSSSVCSTDG